MKSFRSKSKRKNIAISTIVGAALIAMVIFIVMVGYLSFEMNQRTLIDQAANQRNGLDRSAGLQKIVVNASLDSYGNLQVNISNPTGSSSFEIVSVIVGNVNPYSVLANYTGLKIGINPMGSHPFDTTVKYITGNPLWAEVTSSLGTNALAVYPPPAPMHGASGGGGISGGNATGGNIGDLRLNFQTFSWYRVAPCVKANPSDSGYCLTPSQGRGNSGFTIYSKNTSQPLAFSASVVDVNPQHLSITLDSFTDFLQFQTSSACGSTICSYKWFILSNTTGGQILSKYVPITLTYGVPYTIVFGTASSSPCTTSCSPSTSFQPVTYTPQFGIASNLIFAHGWKNIPTSQPANFGQNMPFVATIYFVPQITLSPASGPIGTTVNVTGSYFWPSSTINIMYNNTLVATTVSSNTGTFFSTFSVPQSRDVNNVTATDSVGNAAWALFDVPDINITANPTSLTVEKAGPPSTSTITVTSLYGFTGSVALSVSVSPSSGLLASLNQTSITLGTSATSTLTLTASTPGNYTVTVTGVGTYSGTTSTITRSTTLIVAVPTLAISPSFGYPGRTQIVLTGGDYLVSTSYNYCLSTSNTSINCLSGTTHTFVSTSPGTIPSSTSLTVPSTALARGDYVLVYQTAIDANANFQVEDFSLTANPNSTSISVGTSGSSTITVTSINGFAGTVSLSASVSPTTGLSISLAPTSVVLGTSGTSTLSFTALSPGSYSVTVSGSSNGVTHSVIVTVNVGKAPTSTSVSCVPSSIEVGGATTSTCTATVSGGYSPTGTVSFTTSGTGSVSQSSPSCTLSSGSCSVILSASSAGSVTITATYSGDSNNVGSSGTSSLTVSDALKAPSISVNPAGIDSGQSATLSTTSSFSGGISPYTCQWLAKAPSATSYSNLGASFTCTAGSLPTVSTGSLSVTGSWSFELQVTDSLQTSVTVTSNVATVTVSATTSAVSISPSPSTVDNGQSSKITVAWSGGTPSYTVSLNSGTSATSCASDSSLVSTATGVSGTTTTFTVSPSSTTYYCATVTYSSSTTASSTTPSQLTVNPALVAPSIATNATNVNSTQGQTATLSSTAITTGTAPYTYQWYEESPRSSSFVAITGATLSDYNFTTTTSTTTGNWTFELVVTDSTGETVTSNNITITVSP